MVTNAINTDLKVNAPGGTKARESDGGFSDVLGNVSSENGRRQPGLSGSGRSDADREFSYTKKGSETVRSSENGPQKVGDQRFGQQDRPAVDEVKADELLSQAAETVTRTVAEVGEAPTKEEAAGMMSEALRSIVSSKEDDPGSGDEVIQTAEGLVEVLADVIAEMNGTAGGVQDVGNDIPVDETNAIPTDEPAIHVITPDSSFLMTEKHVEAAMIAESGAETEYPVPEYADEFEEMLGTLLYDDKSELDDYGLKFTENAREMFAGRTEFDDRIGSDGKSRIEKVLAKLETESTEDGVPITEMQVVKDTAEMLGQIIEEAKKKLNLTDVKYERVAGENEETTPLIQDTHIRLSHEMNRSDRTDELDHILNGHETAKNSGRFDVSDDDSAPKTETYDAVHLSAQLMGSRTETDIPVERMPAAEETAEIRPPEIQTAEEILDRIQSMQDDHTEFTMVLNPESLGRITVKLVMAGERTAVEITAENLETRAILAARSENLQTMLRDNGVELERYQVVSEQEDAMFRDQSYEGSSRNPYSREDGGNSEDSDDSDSDNGENFYDILGNI